MSFSVEKLHTRLNVVENKKKHEIITLLFIERLFIFNLF